MPKRTYQPKNKKRKRVHGFLKRSKNAGGRKILRNRRRKNKKEVSK